ncbi:hypothetical protein AALO_G00103470 [Alosa alosa]|uniref:Uncharacterized protein n=1 Tax=Alosa alosa TaxID=278164 RepID=A0AAV6GZG3_9TELE|nr:hypothetical protein AALO_G00103470 [Alosa alosa]
MEWQASEDVLHDTVAMLQRVHLTDEMEWATRDEHEDIANMLEGLHLSEEMEWTPQTDPVDDATQRADRPQLNH